MRWINCCINSWEQNLKLPCTVIGGLLSASYMEKESPVSGLRIWGFPLWESYKLKVSWAFGIPPMQCLKSG